MRRRVLAAIVSVATVAVVLFGIPLGVVVERFIDQEATLQVEREAVLASREVPADFAVGGDPVELPSNGDGVVFGLYDTDGVLVAGAGPIQADAPTRLALENRVVDDESATSRVVAVPVAADEVVVGAVRAEQSTAVSETRTRRALGILVGLAVGVLAVAGVIGFVLAGRLARPVRHLRDAAVQLGQGDFLLEMPPSGVPELDQASAAMTATARRLDDLVARERSFSSDASHQLRTPLAGLRTAIETELALPRPDPHEVLREAIVDIDRLERTIDELLTIARTSNLTEELFLIADVLADLDARWRTPMMRAGRPFTIDVARYAPRVRGNAATLRHALDVLVENAVLHGAGEVRVEVAATGDGVTLTVSDEGPGFAVDSPGDVAAGDQRSGSGHGMGLGLARRLIEATPGRLTVTRQGPQPRIEIVLRRERHDPGGI